MPRKPSDKPWLHAKSGYWCITLDGKRQYLDTNYQVACRKLKALRANKKREQTGGGRDWLDASFAELANEYLADIKACKKSATYSAFRYRLLRALKVLGPAVRVGEIRKFHLRQIEREITGKVGPTTVKDTLAAVQGVFFWAVENDLVDINPVARYKKPQARRRNRVITPDEFQRLLRKSDVAFRRFLIVLRLTGCRPGEIRELIWEWVDLERGLWVLPDHKTITQQREPRPRIIPLPESVQKLCRWLAARPHADSDHVFLNKRGQPYTKDCVCRKMARVRKRAGIAAKAGEQLILYTHRHTFGTAAAGKVTDLELAELMGHTDVRTTRRYVHLNSDRLHDIQRRAQG